MGTALYESQANEGATQADAAAGDDNVVDAEVVEDDDATDSDNK